MSGSGGFALGVASHGTSRSKEMFRRGTRRSSTVLVRKAVSERRIEIKHAKDLQSGLPLEIP